MSFQQQNRQFSNIEVLKVLRKTVIYLLNKKILTVMSKSGKSL